MQDILVSKEDMHSVFYDHPDRLKTPLIKEMVSLRRLHGMKHMILSKKKCKELLKIMDLMHLLVFLQQDVLMKKIMFFKK